MVTVITKPDVPKMPSADIRDMIDGKPRRFADHMDRALYEIGFVGLRGIDPSVMRLREGAQGHLQAFFRNPHETKMAYKQGDGQRDYTPLGVEQSGAAFYGADTEVQPGEDEFKEWREHLMTGECVPPGHPLEIYQRAGFQKNNQHISQVPQLIQTLEALQVALGEPELLVYEGIELALGLPRGTLAEPHVYGNSSIRSHNYPAIPASDILGENKEAKGYTTLRARVFDPETRTYKVFNRLIRAAPHKDIDTSAFLLGATRKGLRIKSRQGGFIPFTAEPDQIVFNGGDYLEHVTGGHYPSPLHFVELDAEMAKVDRTSIVLFSHPRLCSIVEPVGRFATEDNKRKYPPTLEGVLLFRRIKAIGYDIDLPGAEAQIHRINEQLPDKAFVEKALAWEDANGVTRLRRYHRRAA